MRNIIYLKTIIVLMGFFLISTFADAQNNNVFQRTQNYRQTVTPQTLDNYLFSTFYATNKRAYNLKGFELGKMGDNIVSIKVNPAGASYALLSYGKKRNSLSIFSSYEEGKVIYEFDKTINPVAMEYSADSRSLYVIDADGNVTVYDSKNFTQKGQWFLSQGISKITSSSNGYFLAAVEGNNVIIVNLETQQIRTKLSFNAPVADMAFSKDASLFAIIDKEGQINIYNTRDFSQTGNQLRIEGAQAIDIHPDNKYMAVTIEGNRVNLINMFDNNGARFITNEPSGGVSYVRFIQDKKKNTYLSFNAVNSIKYQMVSNLPENKSKTMREEIMARMEEWSKMNPGETEEEYNARMTEESRLTQVRLIEEEIATRMADDLVMHSNIKLGSYNSSNQTLTVDFDNMPSVYLTVPEDEIADFMDAGNLEFRNAIYGLTEDDKFELVYADVYNKATGKTYQFNNRDRKSLDFLYASDDFVPIELVKQTGMEEVALAGIRNSVVEQAKQENIISDHTSIDVNTNVVSDVDADGRKITNYKIDFRYTVDAEYSSKEDFAAGKYKINDSPAAVSMLKIIISAFENDFAQYIKPGKKVLIKVTGSADALPIHGTIAYDGTYGDYVDEPYSLNGDLSTITLTKQGSIKKNEQLAFTRAVSVLKYLETNLPSLNSMAKICDYNVEVSENKGAEFRRISVEFTFVDAF